MCGRSIVILTCCAQRNNFPKLKTILCEHFRQQPIYTIKQYLFTKCAFVVNSYQKILYVQNHNVFRRKTFVEFYKYIYVHLSIDHGLERYQVWDTLTFIQRATR